MLTIQNNSIKNSEFGKSLINDSAIKLARKILAEVMMFRRTTESMDLCSTADCQKCASLHVPKIISAVKENKPVTFVLPAFPGKSPNPEKVLGHLPDQAERIALNFLGSLCLNIEKVYPPGIKIILCSDGRVFNDVIGIQENNVTAYQVELDRFIEELDLAGISIFNLDDFYKQLNFGQMREELLKSYGKSLDFLQRNIRNGAKTSANQDEQELNRMYCGITRFLFEDATHRWQTKSRSTLQKESRCKAYEVLRRSNAWSELIAERFPEAVRLSIHPQACGAKKLGIRLVGNESWMTPWHGVAVENKHGYVLLKRLEAEALGAQLIYSSDGRPSHYKLISD